MNKLDESITEIGQRLEGQFCNLFTPQQIESLMSSALYTEIDKESEKLSKEALELEKEREKRETQQSDDQRTVARQQKNVERYLAKRQILIQRKDECNKNIRDLGVLPEEAFVETTASSEKVTKLFLYALPFELCEETTPTDLSLQQTASQEITKSQRSFERIRSRQQESL